MKQVFVKDIPSRTREENFNKYLNYSDELKKMLGGIPLTQWINGSFVTKKTNPNDIDVLTFIEHNQLKKLGSLQYNFRKSGSWQLYGVDAYIIEVYPSGNKFHKFSEIDKVEWLSRFTKTKRDKRGEIYPKGCIEIIY